MPGRAGGGTRRPGLTGAVRVRTCSTNSSGALRAVSGRPPARQGHDGHRAPASPSRRGIDLTHPHLPTVSGPFLDGTVPPRAPHAPPHGTGEKPGHVDEHSGRFELVVVAAHRAEEFVAGRCARLRISLDHQHTRMSCLLPSRAGPATTRRSLNRKVTTRLG